MNDDWAQWAGNSKFLFYYGFIDNIYFSEVNHSNYPVFIMINEAFLCKFIGNWSDFFCKSFLAILFIDFVLYFYCYLRKKTNQIIAISGSFILVSIPEYVRVGLNGTAEIPMSIYVTIFAIRFLIYLESKKTSDIIVLSIIAGILVNIKSESLFLVAVFSIITLIFVLLEKNLKTKNIISYISIISIFIIPWKALLIIGGCNSSRLKIFTLNWIFDYSSYISIYQALFQILIPSKALSILGFYFMISCIFWSVNNKRDKETTNIILLVMTSIVVYAVGCFSTGVIGAYSRLLTHNLGLFVLVICFQLMNINKIDFSKTIFKKLRFLS
jgi:hypothetical protein